MTALCLYEYADLDEQFGELAELARRQTLPGLSNPIYDRRPLDSDHAILIDRAVAAIADDPAREWSVEDLAAIALFSKFHFSRLFVRAVGMAPGHYVMHVRIRMAMRLLATTGRSVTEVTHDVGYSSVGTFSGRFSAVVGLTPTAYRLSRGQVSR